MDESIVPMSNAPRVLFTGINAGIAKRSRKNKNCCNERGERWLMGAVD